MCIRDSYSEACLYARLRLRQRYKIVFNKFSTNVALIIIYMALYPSNESLSVCNLILQKTVYPVIRLFASSTLRLLISGFQGFRYELSTCF